MMQIMTRFKHEKLEEYANEFLSIANKVKLSKNTILFLTASQLEALAEKYPHNNTLTVQKKNAEIIDAINLDLYIEKLSFERLLVILKNERQEEIILLDKLATVYYNYLKNTLELANVLSPEEIKKFQEVRLALNKLIHDAEIKMEALNLQIKNLETLIENKEINISQDKESLVKVIHEIYVDDKEDHSILMSLKKVKLTEEESKLIPDGFNFDSFAVKLNKVKGHLRASIPEIIMNGGAIDAATLAIAETQKIKENVVTQLKDHYKFLSPSSIERIINENTNSPNFSNLIRDIRAKISPKNQESNILKRDELANKIGGDQREVIKFKEIKNNVMAIKEAVELSFNQLQKAGKKTAEIHDSKEKLTPDRIKELSQVMEKLIARFASPQANSKDKVLPNDGAKNSAKISENSNESPNYSPPPSYDDIQNQDDMDDSRKSKPS